MAVPYLYSEISCTNRQESCTGEACSITSRLAPKLLLIDLLYLTIAFPDTTIFVIDLFDSLKVLCVLEEIVESDNL